MTEILLNPWDNLFYNPIYNLIVLLLENISDFWIVIVIVTIIVKLILFPLFSKQIKSQIATKKAKPEIEKLNAKYKGKVLTREQNQEKVKETLKLYKEYGIKPFSSLFILFIQIPAVFALYWVFFAGGFPEIDKNILYSFVEIPKNISMDFLGLFSLQEKSIILALIAAITQYLQMHISMPDVKFSDLKKNKEKNQDLKTDLLNSFQVNIKYGLPVLVFFMLIFIFNSTLAIYWITLNIFSSIQELILRKKKKELKSK